jgi:glycosyltransferase involved in cell wall biosynthesis
MTPRIDFLLPFYGDPERLRQTVLSVIAQTVPDWRLVVVDDAWPGASVEPWLASLDDPRIEYHRNPTNLGVNGNFRLCLELAEAEHIAFPGDDDVLGPRYVDVVLRAAGATGAAIVQPAVRVIDEVGVAVRPMGDRVKSFRAPRGPGTVSLAGESLAASLLRGNWAYFPALCWKREAVQRHGFQPGMDVVLDLRLLLDLVLAGEGLAYVPDECFCYRRHKGSVSSLAALSSSRFDEEAALFDWAAASCEDRGWPRAAAAARGRLTSRLHAVSLLPAAVRRRDRHAVQRLTAHALGRGSAGRRSH